MGERRRAREYALMILYSIDVADTGVEAAVERFFTYFANGEDLDPPPPWLQKELGRAVAVEPPPSAPVRRYASRLVEGVTRNQAAIDQAIQRVSTHWRLDRMARVDRNLLRLGAFELTELASEVPKKVVINEAVEIAKRYGTAESSAFVNGILDRIGKPA